MTHPISRFAIVGFGLAVVRDPDGSEVARVEFDNLITEYGDRMYAERGGGVASPPAAPTGMRLGTGTTAPSKTGAGAAIVTYISGSSVALSVAAASALSGANRRITYEAYWAAGVATSSAISEVVVTNAAISNVAGTAGNTASRALINPIINKEATHTLTVTWRHDLIGS